MATRIDFEPGAICFSCLVPREQTPSDEEWCFDFRNRPLCGQCARDECVIHEPLPDIFPMAEPLSATADLSYFLP